MTSPDSVRLQVMGSLRVWRGGVEIDPGPRQQRCLLAVMAAQVDRPIGMGDLIDLIWGADPPGSAVNVIHKYVGALRRLLEPGLPLRSGGSFITRRDSGYRFAAGPESLDLVAFRDRVALARKEPDQALDHYVAALSRCEGPAGGSLADSAGATAVFTGIDGEFLDAAVAAAEVAVREGRPAAVLAALRLAARIGRLHEPVQAALMTTLAAGGYQAEALETYRVIRERLAEELGLDPGRELQDAHQQVLTQAPAPATDPRPVPADAPLLRPAQLPPDQPMFVGRTVELGVLHDLVDSMRDTRRTSPMVVAVDGMGGVGKSTVVTHFAHQVAADFTDGQLFLDLRGHEGEDGSVLAAEALRSLLYGLGLRADDVPDTFDALVGAYRSRTAGKRILVMLDDARDASQVRPLLPNSVDSLVLITSRRPLVGLSASDGARLYRAYVPDLADARQILTSRLAYLRNPGPIGVEPAVIDEIIELCGRLPLALAILAARLSVRPKLSLATVAAELRDGAQRLAAFPEGRGVTDPRTAFSWSYRQLSPGAARLFRLLSVALTPGITLEAGASLAGQDVHRVRAEIEELTEAALTVEHESGCFTSHVLVRAYADELFRSVDPVAAQRAAVTRLLQFYLHSSYHAQVVLEPNRTPIAPEPAAPGVVPYRPASYREAIDWFAGQREVLKEAVRVAADLGHGIVPWQLAITMQQYFEWFGHFQDWEDVMRFALRAARENRDVLGEAHVLRSLAGARWFLNAYEESLSLLSAALQVFVDRGMLLEQALTHINFHSAHTALGEHETALEHARIAVELCRAAGNEKSEMRCLDCMGRSLTHLGQYAKAAVELRQALDLNLAVGRRHEEAMIRVSIAHNLIELGRTADAVAELRRAVEAARSVGQGPYHFEAFRSLAELLIETGDVPAAREAFDRASGVLQSFQGGGPRHMQAELRRLAAKLPS
ncbi:AfsR/SARP family transcriptional regulator [Paractinoplanes durhamensis]|uniref:SARP family transcriptional regulator n=1 Tax=Paractinoplanes durhamensis TaxID=113563 RepID=A0ABQ3YRW4_9ACTN|nr:BTAD domain-containing putative transcriptional regulator [Actinoplanes durhamensis]GIE00291.1 SARP family transcriptional regulator [Actinoplanes durhamensis]